MGHMRIDLRQRAESPRVQKRTRAVEGVTRQLIIDEALKWEGTPFHHQESSKGVGCDCKGLVYGVAKKFGLDRAAGYTEDVRDYRRSINGHRMRKILDAHMDVRTKDEMQPADVLWLSFMMFPQHLGILMPGNQIIHASEPDGKVIRHDLSEWWKERVCRVYSFRGLVDG